MLQNLVNLKFINSGHTGAIGAMITDAESVAEMFS